MAVRLDHFSLAVSDLDAAIDFFCNGLGFTQYFVERGMTGQIASMLGLPDAGCDIAQLEGKGEGVRLELIAFRHGEVGRASSHPMSPGMGHVACRVDEFESTLARLLALGAEQLGSVTQFEAGKAVYLRTPFHAFLEIQEGANPEIAHIAGGDA